MVMFILKRLGSGVIALFVVSALAFFLLSFGAGNVARKILGDSATPDQIAQLDSQLGLDRSPISRYGEWLIDALHGNLGDSWFTGLPVADTIASRLPTSLSIIITTMVVTTILAVAFGLTAAVRRGWIDRGLQIVSIGGSSIPQFVVGILFATWFAVMLHWFPATGYVPLTESVTQWAWTITLPVAALAFHAVSSSAQQFRSATITELGRDYVRTLRSRGLSRRDVLLRHVLRAAAPAGLTIISLQFISLLGSSVVIEQIFALPGMGFLAVTATSQGDTPVLMGVIVVTVILVVIVNLLVDLAVGWLNPKARAS